MLMSFNINNIKKFYKPSSCKYRSDIFEIIVGYDFINQTYISSPLGDTSGLYNRIISSANTNTRFYTFKEAVAYIDSLIKKEADKLDIINSLKFSLTNKESTENYRNEYLHLFSAFKETNEQIKYLDIYLNDALESKSEREIKLYRREIAKTHKAIKRLKKRYFYYFGEKAEEIQTLVLKQSYLCNIETSLYYIKKDIEKLEKQKELLIKKYNNI